jgi:NADPH-dependent curcumin reductase CurA
VGDYVNAALDVQEYCLIPADQVKRSGMFKIDPRLGLTSWLNVLGMPGMTGYFGLLEVGLPKAGETVVVSGAAGAVGQTVGQIAKLKGCRVVGIAGGQAKCDWVVKELGFDACIDYKNGDVRAGLKEHCPKGMDIYFDNVGGEILDMVLARLARGARIIICGAISQYNNTTPVKGPANYLSLLVNRARMEGIVVFDYADRYHAGRGRDGGLPEGRHHEEQGRHRRRPGHLPGDAAQAVQRRELRQAGAAGRKDGLRIQPLLSAAHQAHGGRVARGASPALPSLNPTKVK